MQDNAWCRAHRCIPALILALSGGFATSAVGDEIPNVASPAQVQFIEDIGASQRIDAAGKLRMLSQRIVAMACNYAAGIADDVSRPGLAATTAEFRVIVDALAFGNPDLGIIGAEQKPATKKALAALRTQWEPAQAAVEHLAQGPRATEVGKIASQSASLLAAAKLLVSQISAQYSDPTAVLQADAFAIDIAGRQRMLTQRMSKNVCLVASDINRPAAMRELAETAETFDISLRALRDGRADVGISQPPTTDIADGLDQVIANWQTLQPIVDKVLTGNDLTLQERAAMFLQANTMTQNMNAVVALYVAASKLGL